MPDQAHPTALSELVVYVSSPVPSGHINADHILAVHGIVSSILSRLKRAGFIADLNRVIACPDDGCYKVPLVKTGGLTFGERCPVTTFRNELRLVAEALENPVKLANEQLTNKELATSDISGSLQTAKQLHGKIKDATAMAVVATDSTTTIDLRRTSKAEYVEANSRLKPTTSRFEKTIATVAAVVQGSVILDNGLPAYSRWPDVMERLKPGSSVEVMARETKRKAKVLEIYEITEDEQVQGELYESKNDVG